MASLGQQGAFALPLKLYLADQKYGVRINSDLIQDRHVLVYRVIVRHQL